MRVTDLLPFVSSAKLVNSRYEQGLVSTLTFPRVLPMPGGLPPEEAVKYFSTRAVTVYIPTDDLNFRVPDLTTREYKFLANLPSDTSLLLKIQEVDYQGVLQGVVFDDKGGAYFDFAGVSEYEELPGALSDALNDAVAGDYRALATAVTNTPVGASVPAGSPVREAVLPRGFSSQVKRLPIDRVERLLHNYLTSREGSERVPVLFGYTAVAKSALVKSLAKKLGRRMVDFRCAFLDKQNIEGFRQKVVSAGGEVFSTTAVPEKILQCTDRYLDYCSTTAQELKDRLPKIVDPKQAAATRTLIANLEEMAVPPVLFFDEVTRAAKAVQQAFVQILNQKSFRGMDMKKARVVGATNHPVGLSEDYSMAFLTEEMDDAGVRERYEPVVVTPEDVAPRWFNYIEGDGSFDPAVLEFLNNDRRRAYDLRVITSVVNLSKKAAGETGIFVELPGAAPNPLVTGEQDVGVIPFPNFRTWEFVSDHIRAVRAEKAFLDDRLVFGFIGEHPMSREFLEFVRSRVPEAKEKPAGKDYLTESIDAAFSSGTPILIMGMTSIGKTSRIMRLGAKHNAKVITINLAQRDRVDVQGAPVTVPVRSTVLSPSHRMALDDSMKDLPVEVLALLDKKAEEHLPNSPSVTKNAPDQSLRMEIDKAMQAGQKVVLFFDELNRADNHVMSSVLEAVSDQRFGGVSFPWRCVDPEHQWTGARDSLVKLACPLGHPAEPQVMIAAACNYGENYSGGNKLDSAISGRFAMIQKLVFDDTDRQAVLDFMRTSTNPKYPEILIKFIESKPLDELKTMLASVESRSYVEAAPSLRAFSDMAKALNQIEDPALRGKLPNEEWEKRIVLEVSSPEEALERLALIPDNWAGYLKGSEITVGDQSYPVKDFVDSLRDTMKALQAKVKGSWFGEVPSPEDVEASLRDFNFSLQLLQQVNAEVLRYRELEFTAKFGPTYTQDFLKFYNSLAGDLQLTVKDVVSPEMALKYADYILDRTDDPNAKGEALLFYILDFYGEYGDRASVAMYQAVWAAIVKRSPSLDMTLEIVMHYTRDGFPWVRGFFNKALDAQFTTTLLNEFHMWGNVTPQEVEEYYQAGLAPKGQEGHPPRTASSGGSP